MLLGLALALAQPPLSFCCWAGLLGGVCSASVLRRLMASSADVNYRDSSGKTALEYAMSLGHVQCARILTGGSATGAGVGSLAEDT